MYSYTYTNDSINLHMFEFKKIISKDEFDKFKLDFDNLLEKKEAFYVVFNLLGIEHFDIKFFYKKMDYIYSKKEIAKQFLKASSIVIKNLYGKLIKLGFKIRKPLSETCIVDNIESGIQFLLNTFQTKSKDLKDNQIID